MLRLLRVFPRKWTRWNSPDERPETETEMTTPGGPYQESQDSVELRLQEPDPDHKQASRPASASELIRVSTESPETLERVLSFPEALALSALSPARDAESETAAEEHQRARAGDG